MMFLLIELLVLDVKYVDTCVDGPALLIGSGNVGQLCEDFGCPSVDRNSLLKLVP